MTPWTAVHQALLSFTSWSLLRSCPLSQRYYLTISSSAALLSSCPPSFPIGIFCSESALRIRWPKYWRFSFNISPSNEYSGLIPFKTDWFGLLAVQGTLKSFLQRHNLKTSVPQYSVFFLVQLSHDYWKKKKPVALTIWTFAGKVISLLFNMLSRFVIAFLPRSKCLLISLI